MHDITSNDANCQKACLTQKALSEVGDNEPEIEAAIVQSMNGWQLGFLNIFEQALESGEVSNNRSPQERMQYLVMGIFGLRTYAQTQPDKAVLETLAQQLFEDVCR